MEDEGVGWCPRGNVKKRRETLVMRSLQLLGSNDYNSVHFNVPIATDAQASNTYFSLKYTRDVQIQLLRHFGLQLVKFSINVMYFYG